MRRDNRRWRWDAPAYILGMRFLPTLIALAFVGCGALSQPPASSAQQAASEANTARVESTGLDQTLIEAAINEARGLPQLRALIIVRDGETLVEAADKPRAAGKDSLLARHYRWQNRI